MNETLFNPNRIPKIYAYTDEHFPNCLKVGYTTKSASERVKEQYPIKTPHQTWKIVLEEIAIRKDNTYFTDHEIHKRLEQKGIVLENGEWFRCRLENVQSVLLAEKERLESCEASHDFKMRPEQEEAVERIANYFSSVREEGIIPHFLWNAKMRFGKTFAAYQLALKMNWKKVLVLTFKPAVLSAWKEDLQSHIDFENWQFVSNREEDLSVKDIDRAKPFVYFGSFQDHLGLDSETGGIKSKNEWAHQEDWDCIIFDEYHFGAWRDKSKGLFSEEEKEEIKEIEREEKELEAENSGKSESFSYFDEDLLPIKTKHYLYLSGTPFRAIANGEFIEEQIFNWTYSDEQKSKKEWKGENNPYASLPRMVMMTYQHSISP